MPSWKYFVEDVGIDYTIVKGLNGKEYAKFKDELSLEHYCTLHRISPTYYCVDGFMNGVLIEDLLNQMS